jgi:hypothetical protein
LRAGAADMVAQLHFPTGKVTSGKIAEVLAGWL